jgi:hypothetical protein
MERVASFEEFRKNSSAIREDDEITLDAPVEAPAGSPDHSGKEEHYMFFRNLTNIKHNIEEILAFDSAEIDAMISDGHDWAEDHVTVAKEDIQQVADWIRGEFEAKQSAPAEPAPTPATEEDHDDEESDDTSKQEGDEDEETM